MMTHVDLPGKREANELRACARPRGGGAQSGARDIPLALRGGADSRRDEIGRSGGVAARTDP